MPGTEAQRRACARQDPTLFEFADECRAVLTRVRAGHTGQRFVQFAELFSLPGCHSFSLVAEPTIIAGTQTRGAMASVAVDVVEVLRFRHKSGFERRDTSEPGEELRTERFLFTLEQQRRPPVAGCWMVRSFLPERHHMLFNGDSGAVQG